MDPATFFTILVVVAVGGAVVLISALIKRHNPQVHREIAIFDGSGDPGRRYW